MVLLSLFDLSLLSISNNITKGTIQNPHLLPPLLRQRVLDEILKRGLINDLKCLDLLSSVEFLNGLTSISTSAGNIYDGEFLRRLIKSMAVKLPNGETVGAAMKKLDLSVYGCRCIFLNCSKKDEREVKISSFPTVSQLIAQCPNVTSLALRGIKSDGPLKEEHRFYKRGVKVAGNTAQDAWFPCFFHQNDTYKRLLENLVELSVSNWTHILDRASPRPTINFKQLTKLTLDNCTIDMDVWPELLRKIPTLECLHLIEVFCFGRFRSALDWALPFSMPHLKSLEIIGDHWKLFQYFIYNKAFVDNLIGCPELRQVHLMLDQESTDEASLARLASMDIDLKIKTRLMIRGNDNAENAGVIDSSSHFKIASYFHERMESFELTVTGEWTPFLSTALEHVITTCSNLTTFRICLPTFYQTVPVEEIISNEDMKRINEALVRLFGASERALQLKDLHLNGNFDEAVVSTVFKNCLNLDQLDIICCPALRDQHLIDWVSRDGGKLSSFSLYGCNDVTSEGIIPILARSAQSLLSISFYPRDPMVDDGGRDWKEIMKKHCPNAHFGK